VAKAGTKIKLGPHDKLEYIYGVSSGFVEERVGVLVSLVDENKVYIGWAFYHSEKEIRPFDCAFGRKIAIDRAKSLFTRPGNIKNKIPKRHAANIIQFVWRCRRYYKDKILPNWTIAIPPEPPREEAVLGTPVAGIC